MHFIIKIFYKRFLLFLGYDSKYSKQIEKAGGSIKMYGVCPSRISIKIWQTGKLFYYLKLMYLQITNPIICQLFTLKYVYLPVKFPRKYQISYRRGD